jgi:hypothetical protein
MGFARRIAAPSIEGVVDQHPGVQLSEIVVEHSGKPEGRGHEAGSFRRQFGPSRVSRPHHRCQAVERRG